MYKKTVALPLALTLLFCVVLDAQFETPSTRASSDESLTSQELQVVGLINGTSAYNYDVELEKIALNHTISGYAFRSAGSVGADATAVWLKERFEGFGLETSLESFEFTNWNLLSKPTLIIDEDGVDSTTDDQTSINSFQCEHYGWPTPEGGIFADLVVLPLPAANSYSEIGAVSIDAAFWSAIDTTGKIVLIGREVRWDRFWEAAYWNKLSAQPPAAVIYTWWYSWMSFAPPFFTSSGGRPASGWGSYYWNLGIPVGVVSYGDGLFIRNRESTVNVSAKIVVQSKIGSGLHYNVVGRLQGNADPDRFVIVSSHYDTVMTSGFADNGAGTAGVLELARVFTETIREGVYNPDYTILFIAFTSEELGLVGSTNYVRQHKAEMKGTVAVINLDCIGSDSLEVARTDPKDGFDLDGLVLKAASDLNISAALTEPGSSDQETFRNPGGADVIYARFWPDLTAGIGDATPVESSTMLISFPILYSDKWKSGNPSPGWIHTAYDNSTSTQTLDWVEPNSLEEQISVAALSVMRVPSASHEAARSFPLQWLVLGVSVAAVAVAVLVVYFFRVRKRRVKSVVSETGLV